MGARELRERAEAAAAAGDKPRYVSLTLRAAREGDPPAQLDLATWKLWGTNADRDPEAAYKLLVSAGAKGFAPAKTLRATLLGNGTGVARDWRAALAILREAAEKDPVAARRLKLLNAMALDEAGDPVGPPPVVNRLSGSPRVELAEALLTQEECDYVRDAAAPFLQPSMVIDPVSLQPVPHPDRKSDGMNFPPPVEDPVIHAINRRLAWISGTESVCGERLAVLRYGPANEYRPHFDILPGEANQRQATVLVYLNDNYLGGETRFVDTGLSVRGAKGDALHFRNLDEAGRPERLSKHAGTPVEKGVKWLASRWIRQRPVSQWE